MKNIKSAHERDVEMLVNIGLWACFTFGLGLIAVILCNLPKPIFDLLVISMVLGCIVGYIDIFIRNWKGW